MMQQLTRFNLVRWRNYGLLVASVAAYLALTYFAPTANTSNTLGLNSLEINILKITIIVPYLLAWGLALYSLTILELYPAKKDSDELAPTLKAIRSGLGWIIFSLIATALLGGLRSFRPSLTPALTITTNYSYIIPMLIGFGLMYRGMHMRASAVTQKTGRRLDTVIKTIIVLALVGTYSYLVFTNPTRQFSHDLTPAAYYLPDFLIATTIIIPIILVWWLGFSVAFSVGELIPHVEDVGRYKAMSKILYGIWSIIFTSILLQALLSLGTTRLLAMGLGLILGLVYIFVIVQGIGYLFLALGVHRIQKTAQ